MQTIFNAVKRSKKQFDDLVESFEGINIDYGRLKIGDIIRLEEENRHTWGIVHDVQHWFMHGSKPIQFVELEEIDDRD